MYVGKLCFMMFRQTVAAFLIVVALVLPYQAVSAQDTEINPSMSQSIPLVIAEESELSRGFGTPKMGAFIIPNEDSLTFDVVESKTIPHEVFALEKELARERNTSAWWWSEGRVVWLFSHPQDQGYSVKLESTDYELSWASGRVQIVDGIYKRRWGSCAALKISDSGRVYVFQNGRMWTPTIWAVSVFNPCEHGNWPNSPL